MKRNEVRKLWDKHKLSCRHSFNPEFIKGICKDFQIPFDPNWIYTSDRYRELSDGNPRVDGEDFLIAIAKHHNITKIEKWDNLAHKLCGEGSRRDAVQWSYLGRD